VEELLALLFFVEVSFLRGEKQDVLHDETRYRGFEAVGAGAGVRVVIHLNPQRLQGAVRALVVFKSGKILSYPQKSCKVGSPPALGDRSGLLLILNKIRTL
jgi:hypothetical protein